jgi:hypothetical protein
MEKKFQKYKNKCNQILKYMQTGGDYSNTNFFFKYSSPEISEFLNGFIFNKENISYIKYIGGGANSVTFDMGYKLNDESDINMIMKTCNRLVNINGVPFVNNNPDNLFYEYMAGLCINNFKKYCPNFSHTFHIFPMKGMILNDTGMTKIQKINEILLRDSLPELRDKVPVEKFMTLVNEDNNINLESFNDNILSMQITKNNLYQQFNRSCLIPYNICIITENIKNFVSFDNVCEILKSDYTPQQQNYVFFTILLQVYTTLFTLKTKFTHHDLHVNNVLFIKVPDDKYVTINYIDGVISRIIYVNFIPVIIDYGRCFFDCTNIENKNDFFVGSRGVHDVACMIPNCNTNPIDKSFTCDLHKSGFLVTKSNFTYKPELNKDPSNPELFLTPDVGVKNESSDLNYLIDILHILHIIRSTSCDIVGKLLAHDLSPFIDDDTKIFRPNIWPVEKLSNESGKIKNITDVYNFLIQYMEKLDDTVHEKIRSGECYGSLNINIDINIKRQFEFVPN